MVVWLFATYIIFDCLWQFSLLIFGKTGLKQSNFFCHFCENNRVLSNNGECYKRQSKRFCVQQKCNLKDVDISNRYDNFLRQWQTYIAKYP